MLFLLSMISVSQFTTQPCSFEEDLLNYRAAGIEGIELCEDKLPTDVREARRLVDRALDAGFRISSIQPRIHSLFPDSMAQEPKNPEDRAELFRQSVRFFTEAIPDARLPFVSVAGVVPDCNFCRGWSVARKVYAELAQFAEDHGALIAFEPLSPQLMYQDTFIYGLEQGIELLDSVDSPGIALALDVWHVWQERAIESRLREVAPSVAVVHACDWPVAEPRAKDDRSLPGEGKIDLKMLFAALYEGGYRGDWVIEVLSDLSLPDSLWKREPVDLLRRAKAALEPLLPAR